MAKLKDKKLMLELLKYPATVFYNDYAITIFQSYDQKAFIHYSEGCRSLNDDNQDQEYIVRGHKGSDVFVLRLDDSVYYDKNAKFTIIGSNKRKGINYPLAYYLQQYPSLYDAFGEIAKEIHFLPFIKNPTDDDVHNSLTNDPATIMQVPKLSNKKLKTLLRDHPDCAKHIPESMQTKDIANYLVDKHGGDMLRVVKKVLRDEKLCMKAVRDYATAVRDCPVQTEQIKLEAAKRDGRSLRYIKDPSFAVKLAAVRNHPDAWLHITDEKERRKLKKAK